MQFQAWRATTAGRAIPGESGVREICMRRLEGRAEVAGQRWPAASPDPTLGARESRAQGEAAGRSHPASGTHGPHAEAEAPCQHNWSGSHLRRDFWGARCGKSARRVLRGEGGSRVRLKAALYPPPRHT